MQPLISDRDTGNAAITLLASALQNANGASADVSDPLLEKATGLLLICDVTTQAGTTPTLDVAIQAKIGDNYAVLGRFSQYGAATGRKAIVVRRDLAFATEIALAADPAVGSGLLVNNHDWLKSLRVKWTIAGGGGQQYTFSVSAFPIR